MWWMGSNESENGRISLREKLSHIFTDDDYLNVFTEDNEVNEGADAHGLGSIFTQSRKLRMESWNFLRSLRFLLFNFFCVFLQKITKATKGLRAAACLALRFFG
jgi:hypothetical protein